ncbi:hypothetical protein GCM10020000_03040 [Streptomyces olivoverticillatus]
MTVDIVRFAVLDRLRAWRGDSELELGSRQQRTLLALLLLRQGEPVTAGALVAEVWGRTHRRGRWAPCARTCRGYASCWSPSGTPDRPRGSSSRSATATPSACRRTRSTWGEFDTFVAAAERERMA